MTDNASYPIVGVIPAAGEATRLGPLPCSKEVFPIGVCASPENGLPDVACLHVLRCMQMANAGRAYLVLRRGKWDIPDYLGDGSSVGLPLGYLMMRQPYGVPFTVNQAAPFVDDAVVLLGFPDILFEPRTAFQQLLHRRGATDADVVLGLYPARRPETADMVEVDAAGRVRAISVKPARTKLRYAWVIAAWTPAFTRFMQRYVASAEGEIAGVEDEVHMGELLQSAVRDGIHIDSVCFADGRFIDIGTPEELKRAARGSDLLRT